MERRHRALALGAAAVVLAVCVLLGSGGCAVSGPEVETGGRIGGRVSVPGMAGSGAAVVSAELLEGGRTVEVGRRAYGRGGAGGAFVAVADEAGRYELVGLPEGLYTVTARKEHTLGAVLTDVVVRERDVTELDIVLTATGGITGRVTLGGLSGSGLAGSFVYAEGTSYLGATGDDGSFAIWDVPIGSYDVIVYHEGYVTQERAAVEVEAAEATELGTVELSLPGATAGSIAGTVRLGGGGSGNGGVMVSVDGTGLSATTDDAGAYLLAGVSPASSYVVRARKDGYSEGVVSGVEVSAGATTPGVDMELWALSASGTVAPGGYLALVHNSGRDDLVFSAQFEKNGKVYDHDAYRTEFPEHLVKRLAPPTTFAGTSLGHKSAVTLADGNVFVAYCDSAHADRGTFTIRSATGAEVVAPTVFESGDTEYVSAAPLGNGNVLVAYSDVSNFEYGTFAVRSATGAEVVAPTVFESSVTRFTSAAVLADGNVLIAYLVSGQGHFTIRNGVGATVVSKTTIGTAGGYFSVARASGGAALIAYYGNAPEACGCFAVRGPAGEAVMPPTAFDTDPAVCISAATLRDGRILIAYSDTGSGGRGTLTIRGPSGQEMVPPTVFQAAHSYGMSAVALSSGDVLIAYEFGDSERFGAFTVRGPSGEEVVPPTVFESDDVLGVSATTVANDEVFIAYEDKGNGNQLTYVIYSVDARLELEEVSPNEVRLHNLTHETLSLRLAVER